MLASLADLHDAPAVEEAGIFPQSLWRHSHIHLSEEQFGRARALIESRGQGGLRPVRAGTTTAQPRKGVTVDTDRIEGELKEQEGKLADDEVPREAGPGTEEMARGERTRRTS